VQPYYTRLLAQACGLNVKLATEGEAVVASAESNLAGVRDGS
jgi:histidine phosphotransferase ChpT